MAITSTQQTDILKVVAGLFNAAPGGTNLSDLANAVSGGMTIKQLANVLASNTLFTNGIMAGKVTTDAQAAVLMNNFGLVADNTTTSAGSQALAYFKAQIDAKVSFGDIVYDAVTFLSTTTDATFTTAATLLANKALVAESYSASNSSSDLSVLQNVVSTVTGTAPFTAADVATVLAALSDDVAPAVTAPAGNFSFAENQAAAATLATIAATDNVAVTGFEIASGNDSGFFAIDAAGKITLTTAGLTSAANDFETTPNSFTLGVKAIDSAGNKSAAVDVILGVTDVDEAAPTLTSQVLAGNKVVLTFNEAFDAASIPAGTSFLVTESGTTNIAISAVTVSGQIVTLTLATTPTGTTKVSYTPPGTSPLQDAIGNDVVAFTDKTLTVDTTVPTLSSSTPADNATAVAIANNLVLTFSETVQAGTGNIVITNASDATDTRTIAVTDAQVAFSGSTVTINPTADLKAGANYNVQIAATAVKDAAGNAYAGITNSTALNFSTVASVVSTLTLTTSVDTINGTASDETVDGSRFLSGGVFVNTLGNADNIDGGGGTNTLFAQFFTAAGGATITPASVKNIQTISVENTTTAGAGDTLSLANGDATVKTVKTANNVLATTVSNIQSVPTSFEVSTTAVAFTGTIATTLLAGATDSTALILNNVTGAAGVTIGTVAAGSGYETINITSNGTVASSIVLDDGLASSLATVNVAGANDLTLALTPTTVTKVDASSYTGALTLTAAAANAQVMTVTGGTGNDIISVNGYTTADIINGGLGTDRLTLTNAEAIAATTVNTNVSGIEVIGLSDGSTGTITVSNFGATGLRFGANTAGATTVNYATGTSSLDLQTFTGAGGAVTATIAGVATNDILNMTQGSTALGNAFAAALTINGAETVNLLSQGAANSFTALTITDTAASEALVITGAQNFSVAGATRADSINASGMTGTATLTLTGGTGTTATTITGTANADTLIGSTAGDIISGGAGADFITNTITGAAASSSDVLTGGAGFDTFTLIGSTASAATYAGSSRITDLTVGDLATNTDFIRLSSANTDYAAGLSVQGTAAGATGAVGVQALAQNATAVGAAGMEFLKLTTGVATAATLQLTFNAAIGTGTLTGMTAGTYAGSYYDTTTSQMVIFEVASADATVETADVVRLIGTIDMTAANYAIIDTDNFAAFL